MGLLFRYLLSFLIFSQEFLTIFCLQNIVLIVVDDLRPALGCYDDKNAHTPYIDELAENSFVFTRAFAQQALCAPSRNSFLTSRRPDSLHLYDFFSYWRDVAGNFTTLPQFFKERGYRTKSIGKIFHPGVSSNFSDDQPYSWTEPPFHPATEQYKEAAVCKDSATGRLQRNLVCPVNTRLQPGGTLPDLESIEQAKQFILQQQHITNLQQSNQQQANQQLANQQPANQKEANQQQANQKQANEQLANHKPFFLALGLHKPHIPLKYPKRFLDYHPLDNVTLPGNRQRSYGSPTVAWNPWNDLRKRHDIANLNLDYPFEAIPDEWTKLIRQSYYAAVSYIDELIGQLLLSIKQVEGLESNTIVALVGDHGWSLGEHGEWSKFSNYEAATRVPFIVRAPQLGGRQQQHMRSEHLVELVDLFPTLVQLAGFAPLQLCSTNQQQLCTEGTSLVPLMTALASSTEASTISWKSAVFSQYPRPGLYPTRVPDSDRPRLSEIAVMGYSVRTGRYRYTEWVRWRGADLAPDWSTVHAVELYDHLIDPQESINLAQRPQMASLSEELSNRLRRGWRASLPNL